MCLILLIFSFLFNIGNVYGESEKPKYVDFTISFDDNGEKIEGFEFLIYKIGDFDDDYKVTLTNDFKDYPIDIKNTNESEWNDYANSLKGYIKRDKIRPSYKGKTNRDGLLNVKVEDGLYLVIGNDLVLDDYKYETSPFIVLLPERIIETGQYLDKASANVKFSKERLTRKIDLDVLKVWDDDGNEKKRPEYIEVELLENGKVREIVKLNRKNDWSYIWKGLNPNSSWLVVEKGIDKGIYKVKVKNYKNSFVITNIYRPEEPIKKPPRIPQTGQLWWPVFALSGLGIISILIGYIKEKRKGGIDEK